MLNRLLIFGVISSRCAFDEAPDISFWSVLRLITGANHLGKKIDVVISFPRHRFANLV